MHVIVPVLSGKAHPLAGVHVVGVLGTREGADVNAIALLLAGHVEMRILGVMLHPSGVNQINAKLIVTLRRQLMQHFQSKPIVTSHIAKSMLVVRPILVEVMVTEQASLEDDPPAAVRFRVAVGHVCLTPDFAAESIGADWMLRVNRAGKTTLPSQIP